METKLRNIQNTRILIAETGKSLRVFSKEIEVSQGYLSQILKGDKNPSLTVACKIAKGLDLKVNDIFFINND